MLRGKKWVQRQMLQPDGRFPNDYFGYSIAVSSNALLVGAPKAKWMGVDVGAAHVFEPDSLGNWVETQRLTASDGGGTQILDGVSASTARAIIGAPNGGDLRQEFYNRLGAAYVFERDEQGRFVETQRLAHEDPVALYVY